MTDRIDERQKVRILFLISRFLHGGIEKVMLDYIRHLSAHDNYKMTVAVGIGLGEHEVFAAEIPNGVDLVHLVDNKNLTKYQSKRFSNSKPSTVLKLYDVIVCSPIRRFLITRRIEKLSKTYDVIIDFDCCFYSHLRHVRLPKIAWYHFSMQSVAQTNSHNRRRMARIGHRLTHYDRIVCIAEAMKNEGIQMWPHLADKITMIYNAKNRDEIIAKSKEPVDDARINDDYILAVERLEEMQKDLTNLLRAYKILKEKYNRREHLYLLGKGSSENQLQQLASELGLSDDVVFLGFTTNPYVWMAHCKALVHSAKFEGLPTVIIEGLMLDCLIVSTDCPTGPRELLENGDSGLLVPVGDAEKMASAMNEILTDNNLQQKLRNNLRTHREKFTFEHTIESFNQIIQNLTDKPTEC